MVGLKLAMVVMLWARILWAYPAAMAVLSGFVIYQLFEFQHYRLAVSVDAGVV